MAAMIVEAKEVSKRFGTRLAVDRLDLFVPSGQCFGLLGPNGAGKTTTLRMVYGVTRPTIGTIRVFGIDVAHNPRAVRSRLGVTLQDTVVIDELSTRENLRVFGRYHLLPGAELSKRVEELVDFLELGSQANVPARVLSGGFRRRLAIAQSLLNHPELLVLDEPTTGLDPAVRLGIWSRVRELRAGGATILLTTHYMDEAERLCDRVAIMSAGRIVGESSPAELIASHLAPEAVELECTPDEEQALLEGFPASFHRLHAGRRTVIYLDDVAALVAHIRQYDGGDRRHLTVRQTNLEDVFLALTGTSLEEGRA
jgi:lipooligosaccharide transport system ATP-binding protein